MQYKEKIERKNIVQGVIIQNMSYKSQVNACDEPILETYSLIISMLDNIYVDSDLHFSADYSIFYYNYNIFA